MLERAEVVRTYEDGRREQVAVDLAEVLLAMGGGTGEARLLRVADCRLKPGREQHFCRVQREIWAPGMAAAGMLRGWLGKCDQRFLVFSLWPSRQLHQAYQQGPFTALRAAAEAPLDLESVEGSQVDLEASWRT